MNENEKIELMYRRPGKEEHEVLTDVLDDILITMDGILKRLDEVENFLEFKE